MKTQLLLIGGGGHAKSVIASLIAHKEIEVIGILDTVDKIGSKVSNIPVIGTDADMEKYYAQGIRQMVMGIGSVGIPHLRYKVSQKAMKIGYTFYSVIDPTAIIAPDVLLGEGVYIGKGAVVNAGTVIGNHCIINTGSIIEHDCHLGDFVHIATGATLCGGVVIEDRSHVGAGSIVLQQIQIGRQSIIGAGSVVTRCIKSEVKAYGNPCKEVGKVE